MKKFFILLALWFVTIMSVFAGSFIYDQYKTSEYDDAAIAYIKAVIPELSKWDPATTKSLMPVDVSAKIPEENFIKAMTLFSRLGTLQSVNEPKFEETHTGEQTIVEYNTEARYANGEATINLKLLPRNGTFEIYRFHFSSELLIE